MDVCGKIVKYILFFTNFIVFVSILPEMINNIIVIFLQTLALCVLGYGFMILIDEPKVVEILYEARDSCGTNCEEITNDMVYFNAAVITLTVFSIIIVIISFLGCCGALHERQCMILTYVSLVVMVIIGVSTGAAIVYQDNDAFEMKKPLFDALKLYNDNATTLHEKIYKKLWNGVQRDVKLNFQSQSDYRVSS